MSILLSDFEYFIETKFDLSTRIWVSILGVPKLFLKGQTLGAKSVKKYCHVGTLEAFHLWSLGTNVKAKRVTSHSPPIELLNFVHLLTDAHSFKISKLNSFMNVTTKG